MENDQIKEAKQALIKLRRKVDDTATKYEIKGDDEVSETLEQVAIETSQTVSFALGIINHLEKEVRSLKRLVGEIE